MLITVDMVLNSTHMNDIKISISESSKEEVVDRCKCGTIPKVGDNFYYKSRYGKEYSKGVILEIRPSGIISENNNYYRKSEIEIKPKQIKREERLNTILNKKRED